ncbi:hypothetical protein BKA67DRAFT_561166 [Truncatella angustata]|uniref:Uncharacterized protein n=1 Tax=Truncatella angustata TaxID=152316 RepID=A0A9P8ZZZ1_9PEZI|nr:uncharacterized protein BKA67DRAFT_561166 [Truncatella angustata]KAH6655585.1 hypothetical protein BKA67DRAFT_561166 [Truncatella angustata]
MKIDISTASLFPNEECASLSLVITYYNICPLSFLLTSVAAWWQRGTLLCTATMSLPLPRIVPLFWVLQFATYKSAYSMLCRTAKSIFRYLFRDSNLY